MDKKLAQPKYPLSLPISPLINSNKRCSVARTKFHSEHTGHTGHTDTREALQENEWPIERFDATSVYYNPGDIRNHSVSDKQVSTAADAHSALSILVIPFAAW